MNEIGHFRHSTLLKRTLSRLKEEIQINELKHCTALCTSLPVEITKPKELLLFGLLKSFRPSLTIVQLTVTLRQWIHKWSNKVLHSFISCTNAPKQQNEDGSR